MLRLFLVILVSLFISSSTFPNTGGLLTGTVIDRQTKEPLIGANVLITGTLLGSATDAGGKFSIANVPPGVYVIRFSFIGYKDLLKSDVVVNNVSFTRLNVEMESSEIQLETVTVTGDYFQKNTDAVSSLQSFSYEEIRRAPGGLEDVIRAVSTVPGVGTQANGRNDLIVRGGGPSENLSLIDGLEIQNINHFGTQGATGGPLTLVNLDFVENTDFSTGGFGVRYGDKLSSVLNISLREGRTDRLGGKATISATQFGANLEGPVGKNGNFMFSARRSYLDWIFKAAGFGFIPVYWDFQGKYVQMLDEKNRLEVFSIIGLDNVILNNDTDKNRVSNSRILGSDQNQYITGLTWRHFMKNGYTNLTIGSAFTNSDAAQADSNLVKLFTNKTSELENSVRYEWITTIGRDGELTFGAQYKNIRAESDLFVPSIKSSFGDSFSIVNFNNSLSAHKFAIYSQYADAVGDFDYVLGLRADYFSAIDQKFVFSPRISAGYNIDDENRLTASTGIYHQAPTYIWLANNPLNSGLKQIRAIQGVVGYEHQLRADTKFRVEGYLKKYSNYPTSTQRQYLIMSNTGVGFGTGAYANFGFDYLVSEGEGLANGIEFQLQKKLSDLKFYGIISLSINNSEFTPLNGKTYSSSYNQPIIFNLSGGYQWSNEWEFSVKFRVASGVPYTPFNSDGTQNVAAYNSKTFDTIHQLDVRADRRWIFQTWNLITYIDIQNLYGKQNQFDIQWDNQKKEVLKQSGIGVLPTIGVTAEF